MGDLLRDNSYSDEMSRKGGNVPCYLKIIGGSMSWGDTTMSWPIIQRDIEWVNNVGTLSYYHS